MIENNVLIKGKDLIDENRVAVIPDGVTKIGEHAFESCSSLKEIIIPDSVREIGYRAFDKCSSLEK